MDVLIWDYVDVRIDFLKTYIWFWRIRTYGFKKMVSNMYVHNTYDLKNITCQ
jgi:hypothetical protein